MRLEMTHDLGINLLGTKANKHWWFNQKWGSTQPINGHLTNHNGILGKSWKQGMFMGYIILYRQSFHICLRVSNSGMPRKWGKSTEMTHHHHFFFFFSVFPLKPWQQAQPPFADGRWSRIQRTPARRQQGPEPTYNPGYGWGKYMKMQHVL